MAEPGDRFGNFERHLQSILIAITTASLLFAASYFYNDNRAKAIQQTQLETLTVQVIEMRTDVRSLQNSYVKRDEFRDTEIRLRDLERRVGIK